MTSDGPGSWHVQKSWLSEALAFQTCPDAATLAGLTTITMIFVGSFINSLAHIYILYIYTYACIHIYTYVHTHIGTYKNHGFGG